MSKAQAPASDLLLNLMENAGISAEHPKQTWEDLTNLYQDIGGGIIRIGSEVNSALAVINPHIDLISKEKQDELKTTIAGLSSDLTKFSGDLRVIYDSHSKMSGPISEDDYSVNLEIFNSYVLLQDQIKALIFPAMLTVTEKMLEVQQAVKNRELADPNVISDVEVKG